MRKLTRVNVLGEDSDVSASVRAHLLMVEAQSVKNLMLHCTVVHAATTLQGDVLSPILTAQLGPTPEMSMQKKSDQEKEQNRKEA